MRMWTKVALVALLLAAIVVGFAYTRESEEGPDTTGGYCSAAVDVEGGQQAIVGEADCPEGSWVE